MRHIRMASGKAAVESCEPTFALASKFSQPGIGDLSVPFQSMVAYFFVAKAVKPELMTLHLTQLPKRGPSGRSRWVWGRHHMEAQECSFRYRTGGKAAWLPVEPR